MTHIKTGKGSWLSIKIDHESAQNFRIEELDKEENLYQFVYDHVNEDEESGFYGEAGECVYDLPPGSYTLLSTTKDISEEQAGEIVDKVYLGTEHRGYENYGFGIPKYDTATESLRSLLIANQMNPELNYAILKLNTKP